MMAYLNPISLFELTGPEPPTYGTLRARHKRFLSELELDQLEYVMWGNEVFSQSELADVITACKDEATLKAYYYTATILGLDKFLTMHWPDEHLDAEVFVDRRFEPLLRTVFVPVFAERLSDAYTDEDFGEVGYLLDIIPSTVLGMDNQLYGKLYKSYNLLLAELREHLLGLLKVGNQPYSNNEPYTAALAVVHHRFPAGAVALLPPYFASVNNELARLIVYVLIPLYNEHRSYRLCEALMRTGLSLPHLTEANQSELVMLSGPILRTAMEVRRPVRQPVYEDSPVNGWVEVGMLFVIIILLSVVAYLSLISAWFDRI